MTVGSKTATYAYDADGIRTQKTVDGVTHTYYTLNGKLMRESFPYSDTTIIMDFIYDESGKPFAVCYSKDGGAKFTPYFYATNLQGDVEGIFRVLKNGTTGLYEQKWYGRYTYDAWGNVTAYTAAGNSPGSTTLVYRNPIRYRGYVYDTETGWYYLQSRYYDPANHRCINADNFASTGAGFLGNNMFAYCNNNSVMMTDSAGNRPTWEHDFGNGVVGYADNGTGNYITYINDQDAPGISEKQFGITNVGHGGCGAVAAYNALVKLGKPESFDSVLDYFNGWNSVSRTNIFGLAGMMPKHISAYFKEKGYTVRFYTDEESIDSASRSADACIGWYMYTSIKDNK